MQISFYALSIVGIFILLLRNKLVSPELDVYKSNLAEEQFKKANQAAAKANHWTILANRNDHFSAINGTSWQWDGIKITVIRKKGKLYLNSMVNPSWNSNPLSFGLNKRIKLELIRQYQSIRKGEDVGEISNGEIAKREKEFWDESEWTFMNTIKRGLGYGLSILFVVLSIWIMFEGEIKGLILGISILGFCSTYIYNDIKVILEKSKNRKARL